MKDWIFSQAPHADRSLASKAGCYDKPELPIVNQHRSSMEICKSAPNGAFDGGSIGADAKWIDDMMLQ